MKRTFVCLAIAALGSFGPAHAKNELVLLGPDDAFNTVAVAMVGDGNRLTILQQHQGGSGSNLVDLRIEGDLNGGPLGASFSGAALAAGLAPGSLIQDGFDNAMRVKVSGSANLFAFSQVGSGNSLSASIAGMDNQAVVVQHGINNHAGFSQNGIGNIVSIMQRSW